MFLLDEAVVNFLISFGDKTLGTDDKILPVDITKITKLCINNIIKRIWIST